MLELELEVRHMHGCKALGVCKHVLDLVTRMASEAVHEQTVAHAAALKLGSLGTVPTVSSVVTYM